MQSPFPGMDPYIEGQEWEDFHATFNTVLRESLSPTVEPKYIVRVERRVYVEHPLDGGDGARWSDVAIMSMQPSAELSRAEPLQATQSALLPVECVLPMPEERRETYLVIRKSDTKEVVTVIETLSPSNKRPNSDGLRQYLDKRREILDSQSHLIELDLLRGGLRLPMMSPLPTGDYYAIVSRRYTRPRAQVYAWTLRDRLPTIPIPLLRDDPDVSLDLQIVFSTVYERARYGLSLDYSAALHPRLSESDTTWAQQRIEAHGTREA